MIGKRAKWLMALLLLLGGLVVMGTLYGMLVRTAQRASDHDFFKEQRRPLVIAHRGGAGLWPENTLYAFERAKALGVDVLEMDVQSTADGVLAVMHDRDVDRTTNGTGQINKLRIAELKKLDAGYRWSPDGGKSFPLRGAGITVPTLQEVFTAFPDMRFNIEPKHEQPSLVKPLCQLIRDNAMTNKVIVGSFRAGVLEEFRRECPEVATSASTIEVSKFLAMNTARLEEAYCPAAKVFQVPEYAGGLHVLTQSFVEAAHRCNLEVHVWTINEAEDMKRFLDLGVDGIMTDYPDRLLAVLGR